MYESFLVTSILVGLISETSLCSRLVLELSSNTADMFIAPLISLFFFLLLGDRMLCTMVKLYFCWYTGIHILSGSQKLTPRFDFKWL